MEEIVNKFVETLSTDPVAAMLGGFIAMSIVLALVKWAIRSKKGC